MLYLGACLVFLRSGNRIRFLPGAAVTGLFMLAFLTKDSAITLPGVLFLLDGARDNVGVRDALSYVRRRWAIYLSLTVVAGLILVARYAVVLNLVNPMAPLGAAVLQEGVPRIWTVASMTSEAISH